VDADVEHHELRVLELELVGMAAGCQQELKSAPVSGSE
jgi:hypothetical protein